MVDIKLDKRNYRKHNDRNKELINQSLGELGAGRSILIDNENEIIAGNGVFEQAQKLNIPIKVIETNGEELIAVKRTDLATRDEKRKKLAVMDNSTSDSSEFDIELLQEDFESTDLEDMGINIEGLEFPINFEPEIEEDKIPEIEEKEKTKTGDLWILGNHRLLCGDATKIEDIERLMNGEKADMVFTDPPYGISIVKNNNIGGDAKTHFGTIEGKNLVKATKYAPIKNDDTTKTAELSYKNVTAFSKNQIIFGGNYFTDFLPPRSCWLVWDKENSGNFADVELAWTSFNKGAVLYKWLWNGLCRKGNREIEGKNRVHPTQKPVGLLSDILRDFSKSGEAILDVFGGSGSTLIACEQLERKCFMMELEPRYCDVIIRRWQKLTGQQAILESSGKSFDEI